MFERSNISLSFTCIVFLQISNSHSKQKLQCLNIFRFDTSSTETTNVFNVETTLKSWTFVGITDYEYRYKSSHINVSKRGHGGGGSLPLFPDKRTCLGALTGRTRLLVLSMVLKQLQPHQQTEDKMTDRRRRTFRQTEAEKTEKATDLRVQDRKRAIMWQEVEDFYSSGLRVWPRSGVQMLDNMTKHNLYSVKNACKCKIKLKLFEMTNRYVEVFIIVQAHSQL